MSKYQFGNVALMHRNAEMLDKVIVVEEDDNKQQHLDTLSAIFNNKPQEINNG